MNIATPSVAAKRSFSKEMNRLKTSQQILTILVLLFICMILWIIVSLFSSQNTTTISSELLQMAKPFNPTLSTEVIDEIETKRVFSDQELQDFTIFVIERDPLNQVDVVVELGNPSSAVPVTPATPVPTPVATPIPTQNEADAL